MQIEYRKHSAIVAIGLLISGHLSAQSVDSSAVNWRLDQVDSTQQVRDSLEVVMLRTTQSYQQVERLLNSLPAYRLNLLPSVLPVAVPIDRFRVSSRFGYRLHPIHRQTRFHRGVDVSAPLGMVVKATAEGVVKRVGHDPALGVFVQLQHAFGFETIYGHLSGYCVRPGQTVNRNQELGRVGKTGLATGPHLHYSIKKNGSDVDPFNFCFLLRRRLYLEKSKTSGASVTDSVNRVSSRGE